MIIYGDNYRHHPCHKTQVMPKKTCPVCGIEKDPIEFRIKRVIGRNNVIREQVCKQCESSRNDKNYAQVRFELRKEQARKREEKRYDSTHQGAEERRAKRKQILQNAASRYTEKTGITEKQCTRCGEIKPLTEFYFSTRYRTPIPRCMDCERSRCAELYRKKANNENR